MEGVDWHSLFSSLLAGGGVMAIAKYFLASSAEKLDQIPKDINLIRMELARIEIHVADIAKLKETVREHDRVLAVLTAQNPRLVAETLDRLTSSKNLGPHQ